MGRKRVILRDLGIFLNQAAEPVPPQSTPRSNGVVALWYTRVGR